MKNFLKTHYLPLGVLACSVITMFLRMLLWISAISNDESNLLPAGTWPDVVSWIMVAIVIALLVFFCWKLKKLPKYRDHFKPSKLAAAGMLLGAVGILISSISALGGNGDTLTTISAVLGIVSAGSLGYLAFCRMKGARVSIAFHGIICLYLMLYLISCYRVWSSCAQLQVYAFELLAVVFTMLACYHRAAFDTDQGKPRSYAFFSCAALFFCIAALPGCNNEMFLLGCAAWMFTTPCDLTPAAENEKA
ncbi:MAG: hypothetical protein E7454_00095 [Ruminococcaceae bacterium]|nr:hypothetical protein [Oscillospiraceae bacterium]